LPPALNTTISRVGPTASGSRSTIAAAVQSWRAGRSCTSSPTADRDAHSTDALINPPASAATEPTLMIASKSYPRDVVLRRIRVGSPITRNIAAIMSTMSSDSDGSTALASLVSVARPFVESLLRGCSSLYPQSARRTAKVDPEPTSRRLATPGARDASMAMPAGPARELPRPTTASGGDIHNQGDV
jgi:hypothetical protein